MHLPTGDYRVLLLWGRFAHINSKHWVIEFVMSETGERGSAFVFASDIGKISAAANMLIGGGRLARLAAALQRLGDSPGHAARLLAARVALGLGEGGNFPSAIKAVALWFPKRERATATTPDGSEPPQSGPMMA